MSCDKVHKKIKNISISNESEVQHQLVIEMGKEVTGILTLFNSPKSLSFPEHAGLKANYFSRTESTVAGYQHIALLDSSLDERECGDGNFICGCGCESCCGCGHDL